MRVENLIADLDQPPHWLRGFATFAAERHCVARACAVISGLGRLLHADPVAHPQQLLDRARRPGRSMGTLARTLEQFFTDHGLALPTDQVDRLAAGRRQRRIDAVPESLRPAVQGFAEAMLASRDRARRAGTRPRSDHTIEQHLASVRNVAIFLVQQRHITDWASVGVGDVEAFLAEHPKFRKSLLTGLRQFFRIARQRRLILVDPTAGIVAREPRGFRGSTLAPSERTLRHLRLVPSCWMYCPVLKFRR